MAAVISPVRSPRPLFVAPLIALAAIAAAGVRALSAVGAQTPAAAAAAAPGIDAIFDRGGIFQDRNGDDVIDFVDAEIVRAPDATAGEVAAAANVAARLGHETLAMNLPLQAAGPASPAIVVGVSGLRALGLTGVIASVDALAAGEGVVTAAAHGGRTAIVIAGRDDAGTRAAAELFASRLPSAWTLNGPTLTAIAAKLRAHLAAARVSAAGVEAAAARVKAGGDGLEQLVIRARLSSAADVAPARAALTAANAPAALQLAEAGVRLLRVTLTPPSGAPVDVDVRNPSPVAPANSQRRAAGSAKESLDLSTLFANEGLLGDSDNNLIPDRADVVLSAAGPGSARVVDLAARIGLESAGLTIPIALPPDAIGKPEEQPPLVLVGAAHPLVARLVAEKKLTIADLGAGEGRIEIVRRAFGSRHAVVITGGDAAGLDRALRQAAERFPHLWARGKDRTTLGDVEDAVRRFVSGRSPEGQAATALYKLRRLTADLPSRDLASVAVDVSVEKADPAFEGFVQRELSRVLPSTPVTVHVENRDVQRATPIVDEDFEVPSEVDEFWKAFRTDVLPRAKGKAVAIEARLSEPPAIRASIEREARAALLRAGASEANTTVTVLSAYKQGFSWLYDVVRPALKGKPVEKIVIRFAELGAPKDAPYQALYAPTRWLLEIFPIDELLARDLGLSTDRIVFERAPLDAPAYEVIATAAGGAELLRQTFEPKLVLRPYLDQFASYEQVRVATGWLRAEIGGRVAVDRRIVTDPERFWDHYQAKTLPALYAHIMRVHDGRPRAQDAPFFGELTVDLSLSEPNYEVGVDKEQVMSLEALHEDLYFTTLSFFDVLGRFTRNADLDYPGRIIPIMRPKQDGKSGRAKITVTAFAAPRPMVTVRVRPRQGPEEVRRMDIPAVAVDMPAALSAGVAAGRDGLTRLDVRVRVDSDRDNREALVAKTARRQVDARIISAEQVTFLVDALARLRAAGVYRDALAVHDLGDLRIAAAWTHDVDPAAQRVATLPANGSPEPWPDITTLLPAGYTYAGERLVQWDTPMPPDEANLVLAKLSTLPGASAYKVGQSYLGKDIWALDLMPPIEASHWSQAKATTFKPTAVYTGRQHANEVSSTSHILRLAELLLTDPAERATLRKANVIIHPITNPDGAQLAYDLHRITPDYSLHAGYLGPLGVDATAGSGPDPIYPEALVRPKLWRTWLPDMFLNPHGYPHHMWVQPFSEFMGPVRNGRVTEERHWGIIRGWFMPGFSWLDDPRYPRHKDAAFALRDRIYQYVNRASEMMALNRRAYARYLKYGVAWDDEAFKTEDFSHDILIYTAIEGARASGGDGAGAGGGGSAGGGGAAYMTRYPNVTIWMGTTEAPDETAYGPWLQMVAAAGLQWDRACLDFLVDARHTIDRRRDAAGGAVSLAITRSRPGRFASEASATSTAGAASR